MDSFSGNPKAHSLALQLRQTWGSDQAQRFLIFDRDAKFNAYVVATVKAMGCEAVRTAFRSPWQNGVAERWVGSVRRDLLDHVIVVNQRHRRRLMKNYICYYHEDRTHLGLEKDTPSGRVVAVVCERPCDHLVAATRRPASPLHNRSLRQLLPEKTGLYDWCLSAPRTTACATASSAVKTADIPAGGGATSGSQASSQLLKLVAAKPKLLMLDFAEAQAQHVLDMFRCTLPHGPSRRYLDRLSNRLTKILSEARKLRTP